MCTTKPSARRALHTGHSVLLAKRGLSSGSLKGPDCMLFAHFTARRVAGTWHVSVVNPTPRPPLPAVVTKLGMQATSVSHPALNENAAGSSERAVPFTVLLAWKGLQARRRGRKGQQETKVPRARAGLVLPVCNSGMWGQTQCADVRL